MIRGHNLLSLKFLGAFLVYLLASSSLLSQNLVPNPSFEEHYQCPEFLGSVRSYNRNTSLGVLENWMANPPDCTPDYYHPCGKKKFRAPKNLCGIMEPKEGEGYIGMILRIGEVNYGNLNDLVYREHVTTRLKSSLRKGYQYKVKMHIVLSAYANFAIGNFGALFTQSPIIIKENVQYKPQIIFDQLLRKRKSWMVLEDTLTAQGNELYLTIGNFDDYRNRKIVKVTKSQEHIKAFNFNRAYYFIDMVSVEELGKAPPKIPKIALKPDSLWISTDFGSLKEGHRFVLKNVLFAFDKAELLPESFPELDKLSEVLKTYPDLKIKIVGHTDSIGTENDNLVLSDNRAKRVKDYLLYKGISPNRIQFQGLGESKPIDTNGTDSGRQNNRRVEFVVIDMKKN